ncbi:hypothetical protein D3C87_650760 [compost metagenome]
MPHLDNMNDRENLKEKAIESIADLARIRKDFARSIPSWANEYPMDIVDKMDKLDRAVGVITDLLVALEGPAKIYDPDERAKQKFLDHREKFGTLCESVTWETLSQGIKHYYRNLG